MLKFHKVKFYRYQWRIWRTILLPLIKNLLVLTRADITEEDINALDTVDMSFEYTRQSGKTTSIVYTVEGIMLFVSRLFGIPIEIGIFAPQKEQANTDFKRLKNALSRSKQELVVVDHDANRQAKEESNAKTIVLGNGSSCYIFPVSLTSHPESKTLHLIIIEESQDINDSIIDQEVLPMGASTNAVVVRVGTAGKRLCKFYWAVQKGNAYVMTWPEIAADRRRMYEMDGDPRHLVYEQHVKNMIREHGINSPAIQRPYMNVWQLQQGMYLTSDLLYANRIEHVYDNPAADPLYLEYLAWYRSGVRSLLERDEWARSHNISEQRYTLFRTWTEDDHYFGLDTAKSSDQTVLKIGRKIGQRLTVVRSVQGLRGVNYQDQYDVLVKELEPFNIAGGAIDSTGQGDFMPDLFERGTGYKIYRLKFSLMSKDIMYKGLYNKMSNSKFGYYYQDPEIHNVGELSDWQLLSPEQHTAKATKEFENEFIKLEKHYVGNYMQVKHPDKATDDDDEPHDDHPDSTALMAYAYDSYNESSGILDYYKEQAARERALEDAEA